MVAWKYTGRSFWDEGNSLRERVGHLRPFLSYEKKNSIKKAKKYDVPYLEDESNESMTIQEIDIVIM